MAASFMTYPDTASLKYSQLGGSLHDEPGRLGPRGAVLVRLRPPAELRYGRGPGERLGRAVTYDRLHHIGADAAFALGGYQFPPRGRRQPHGRFGRHRRHGAQPQPRLGRRAPTASLLGFFRRERPGHAGLPPRFASGIASPYDVEDGAKAIETTVALVVDRSFDRDKIKAQVAGIWEIEQEDYMLSPSLAFTVSDDAELRIGGRDIPGRRGGELRAVRRTTATPSSRSSTRSRVLRMNDEGPPREGRPFLPGEARAPRSSSGAR